MECVNCTQCIDACDTVMDKLNRPRGLIRCSSQAALESGKKPRKLRFRVVFYPVIMGILATGWMLIFMNKGAADVTVLRNPGMPYSVIASGLANPLKLKLTNPTDQNATYYFELENCPEGVIDTPENPLPVAAQKSQTTSTLIVLPPSSFILGKREVWLHVSDHGGYSDRILVRLLGPVADTTP